MPNGLAGTRAIMEFIAKKISLDTYINIMDQYRPCGKASGIPEISRPVTAREYLNALETARSFGLNQE
jgi:putative pyruvate formate lyase activating enzyme